MTVAYVSSVIVTGIGVTSLTTPSIDTTTGSDKCLVAGSCNSSASLQNSTGITWDIGTPEDFNLADAIEGEGFFGSDIYSLVAPNADDTVTASWGGSADGAGLVAGFFTSVNQTTPVGDTGTDSNDGNATVTVTLTSVDAGDMCVDSLGSNISNGVPTPAEGLNQTEREEESSGGTYGIIQSMSTQAGSDGGVMTYSNTTASADQLYCAIVLKDVGAAPSTTLQSSLMMMGVGN